MLRRVGSEWLVGVELRGWVIGRELVWPGLLYRRPAGAPPRFARDTSGLVS